MKDFEDLDCDEVDIYRQLFNLDPVFGELFDGLYDEKVNFSSLLENLEDKYEKSYAEKLKVLEKKNAQKVSTAAAQKDAKKTEKTAKNAQKTRNLAEAKKVREENKQTLVQQKRKKDDKEKA